MRKYLLSIVFACLSFLHSNAQCGACEAFTDRIVNGDFEGGNTAFSTSFNYVTFFPFLCTLCPENSYAIGNNATLFHNGFVGTDHTNPPTGDFFIANAPGQNGAQVWCQTVDVLPQTTYTLTFWARDIANNSNPHPLAILKPSFNGNLSADSLIAEGNWSSLSTAWYSDTLSQVDICILNFQTETGGNDFGLDDISLTACEPIQLSQPAIAGPDTTLCSLDILQLGVTAINGYTYSWSNSTALNSTSISNPIFQAENITNSTVEYTLWVTRDSANVGCVATDTLIISVLPIENLELGDNETICLGDSTLIACPGNWDSVEWSTGETSPEIWVMAGNYIATVVSGICSISDTINISSYVLPDSELPEEINHCNTTPLVVQAAVDGVWYYNQAAYENPIMVSEPGAYRFLYGDSTCEAEDTVIIEIFEPLYAQLPSDTSLCEGTSALLISDNSGTWNTGELSSVIGVENPGTFTITVVNGTCVTYDTIVVFGLSAPQLSLGADTTFCEDYPIELTAFNEGATYSWSTGDTTATIFTSGSGLYSVNATNICGTTTDEIQVINFACSWALHIPSSFTPNEDTFNETWGVQGYNIKEIDLTIYNRFGDAIFHSTSMEETWSPSERVGDDVYSYRIEITPFEGITEIRTGVIYLIR
jgi:gliding motility-associated-like protein